jgi:signal transduction histidine kinase
VSLLRKFAILLGLLASTIVVGLGAAFVFGVMLEREVSSPFRVTTGVLTDLARLKRSVGRVELLVADESGADAIEPELARVAQALSLLEQDPWFDDVVGPASTRNMRARVDQSLADTRVWLDSASEHDADLAKRSLFGVHEVIEAIEQRILVDALRSADFGDEMRRLHHVTLIAGMLSSALFGLLAIMLLRRWVLAPVARLGEATQRIASGDFEHRVGLAGRDELAMLGHQVDAMAGSIASMQREAIERERLAAVGEMVRRLAHNLRNPLAGIRNLAELSRMQSADNATLRDLQTEIIDAVDRFNGWLKELLNVTSPMRMHFEDREVRAWLAGIVDSHRPLARMRSVELITEFDGAPDRACFDPRHLEHAIVAILTNAIQASGPGSRVRVSSERGGEDGDPSGEGWWTIAIRDEGPGIPDELREKIFRPYFTTKRDGNGIGLAVAGQVVKRHGGRIDLWTQPERGTHFLVRLPAVPPPSDDPIASADSNHSVESGQSPKAKQQHSGLDPGHRR